MLNRGGNLDGSLQLFGLKKVLIRI